MLKITVVVPTYRRPLDLARCLAALQLQYRTAHEVIVIVRDTDTATWDFLRDFEPCGLPLQIATVTVPGAIAAMNVGLEQAHGDVIAFTDDDAAPRADWLERIDCHFLSDERVGGVGGRDWVRENGTILDDSRSLVGKVQWFGRTIGNHHLGVGAAREVDILKGVNMSFRSRAIARLRFDNRLKGSGAQVHFELDLCLAIKQHGWKLIYDPSIAVDHYPSQRFDEDERKRFSAVATANAVHNETFILLNHGSLKQRTMYLFWFFLVGTRSAFGLVQLLRFLPKEGDLALQKWQAAMQGRWQGWQTWNAVRLANKQESAS
jgi:cellulose synthase/poly-beta-1,6-N-acetylglucosamine synthase-like glycosyltransferase